MSRGNNTYPRRSRTGRLPGTPIHLEDGRVCGVVMPDGTFTRRAKPGHMLNNPPAWAWETYSMQHAEKAGAVRIEVTYEGDLYETDLATFWKYAIPKSWGARAQLALPLRYWKHTPGGAA